MEIVSIEDDTATCSVDGVSVRASVSLVPQARIGDWAIVHAGFAIELLDESEALETIRLFDEIEQAYREDLEKNLPDKNQT
jgi:hydrogenase expression/formation protein HypC